MNQSRRAEKMTQRSADEVAAYMFLYEKERKLFE